MVYSSCVLLLLINQCGFRCLRRRVFVTKYNDQATIVNNIIIALLCVYVFSFCLIGVKMTIFVYLFLLRNRKKHVKSHGNIFDAKISFLIFFGG